MSNDSAEFKALTKATDEPSPSPSPSLIDEVMNHTKETWKDVATGNASTSQYAEATVEALTVTAVGAFLYTRNRSLANSFAQNIDSSLQFTDDVANPALLAQIRATAKGAETLPGMAGKPGTVDLHAAEELAGLGNEASNPALLAQLRASTKGIEKVPVNPDGAILVHPDTGEPLLHPKLLKKSRLDSLTQGLPKEINFGDEAANPVSMAAAAAERPGLFKRVDGASEDELYSMFNFDSIPAIPGHPPVTQKDKITSIIKGILR